MTTTISGTTGVTYPVQAGGTSQVQSSSGKVLQVVNATYSTETSTSSTSYISSGLTATITPSSATSKVLILVSNVISCPVGNNSNFTVFRGNTSGTDLGAGNGFIALYSGGNASGISVNYLDSPNTTSAQTYTCAYKVSGGTGAVQSGGGTATMTLMEIAA